MSEIIVVSHHCIYKGWLPEESCVEKIVNWGPCHDLSEVQAFLGIVGVICIFIFNFVHCAHPLTMLMWKDFPFIFGLEQVVAQEDLKLALLSLPACCPIDYSLPANVILIVNTSYFMVNFHLCQCSLDNPCIWYYIWFGSITLNNYKSQFLQLKLKLYSLFCPLHALKSTTSCTFTY